jgi:hypothetical protein
MRPETQAWCVFVVVLLHGSANGAVSTAHVGFTDAASNVTDSIWVANRCSLPMVQPRGEPQHRRLVHAATVLWSSLGEPCRHVLQCVAYAIAVVPLVVGRAAFAIVMERCPVCAGLSCEVCLALCCLLGTWMKIHQSGHTVSSLVIHRPVHWCHFAFMSTVHLVVPITWLAVRLLLCVRGTTHWQRACLVGGSVLAVLHQDVGILLDVFLLFEALSIVANSGLHQHLWCFVCVKRLSASKLDPLVCLRRMRFLAVRVQGSSKPASRVRVSHAQACG